MHWPSYALPGTVGPTGSQKRFSHVGSGKRGQEEIAPRRLLWLVPPPGQWIYRWFQYDLWVIVDIRCVHFPASLLYSNQKWNEEGKKKILVTLQCFKASLYSLFLIASLALFRAVFTSLLDILSKQKACLYLNKGKGLFKRTIYKFQPEWNYNDTCLTVTVPTNWTNLTSEKGTHNSSTCSILSP